MLLSAVLLLAFILIPGTVYAWGPATHLELGNTVLQHLRFLAPSIGSLIESYPYDYLYGNISADIVVGKNLVEELKHCHNWKIGFKLLKKAESGPQRSFAYGYLSHLAADTVAHNHFIPEMLIKSFSARTHRHIYWEMRFDALADKKVWQFPKKMIGKVNLDNDRLLDSIIEDTPLSFRTNKTIFSSFINLQRVDQWHRMLNLLSLTSKWSLHKEDKERFFGASLESITGLLTVAQKAPCVREDPTGRHSLNAANLIRKKLILIKRGGRDWEGAMDNALKWIKP